MPDDPTERSCVSLSAPLRRLGDLTEWHLGREASDKLWTLLAAFEDGDARSFRLDDLWNADGEWGPISISAECRAGTNGPRCVVRGSGP
jgi:hypothetical protein